MNKEYVDKLNAIAKKGICDQTQEEREYYLQEINKISRDALVTRDLLRIYGYDWIPFDDVPDNEHGVARKICDEHQMIIIYVFNDLIKFSMYGEHMKVDAELERPCKFSYLDELFNFMCYDSDYPEKEVVETGE